MWAYYRQNRYRLIKQGKFTYSPFAKTLEKQKQLETKKENNLKL